MTTIETIAPSPKATPSIVAGLSVRRLTGGLALMLFPALLVWQAIIDPTGDSSGAAMWEAATRHRTALFTSAALLILSGILTLPATLAIMRQARDRGAWLADVGGAAAVLGGIGHVGIGFFYVLAGALHGGRQAEMVAYIDRLNGSTALAAMAFPLIACFSIGMFLLPWAAYRAGIVARWSPIVATAAVLLQMGLPPEIPGQDTVTLLTLILLTVVFGQMGVRVLTMRDEAWFGQRT